ncbi:hypothetical protein D9758_009328 [Tetrapyrgos nigripes]|uniref:DUF6534 domain-containing protein n=1 Tax=Tetrapyrgos nigripes TaxID=182062 RepID=A0A8H5GH61_9AGAR|nr:hypothetical protein D9758_009328 [Tetrapyrgos nigripes]
MIRILVKITVFAALACDMLAIIADCADVYLKMLASTLYLTTLHTSSYFQSQNKILSSQVVYVAVILWLSTAMVADLLIALLLVLYYRVTERHRTIKSSSKLVRRLAALALKTGSFTALTAVLTLDIDNYLALFLLNFWIEVNSVFGFCISSIYSLTFLYNLNIRRKLINRTNSDDVGYIRIPDLEVAGTGNGGGHLECGIEVAEVE